MRNRAAICKLLWNVAQKKDRLWVRWMHEYYIKGQIIISMAIQPIPNHASWIMKKILSARKFLGEVQDGVLMLQQSQFSVRKLYHELRGAGEKVPWHKLISGTIAPPKCVFITWLAMMGRLATWENLIKIGIMCDTVCCLCNKESETMTHLFFKCEFSAQVWNELLVWSGFQRLAAGWEEEKQFLFTQCRAKKGRQKLYRAIFAVAVYHLWIERNMRRFQEKFQEPAAIIRSCKLEVTGNVYIRHRCLIHFATLKGLAFSPLTITL